eukprot:gnl/MRDRNA2_/MRDRNA2_61423_c0_seq2.p1 gnl/MRDRNA2_/MRDRNA2_61423_c0~~gnl/MRDRNA2_/MRDRNA2_61423_c0_seq2.p1  ORF type:complete len:905 (+),score=306.83 gnl/MRDRNA2_/MRDRNA2_61423_c0_seq2:167-2716(+)
MTENHGKPVYKKDQQVNGLDVLIYFWDDRDGPNFGGWWFGPKVGGDQVWAYNPEKSTTTPPPQGWKVPYDGPVDSTFQVVMRGQAQAGGMSQQQQMMMQQQQMQQRQQQQNLSPAQIQQQQQMQQMQRQQQMQQEQARRQQEMQRQQQEMQARKEEMEKQRKEQHAALAIRQVIQRMRFASPETFEGLTKEMEETMMQNLASCGSQTEKIKEEATAAKSTAEQRCVQIKEQRIKEEERRVQEEKFRAESEAVTKRLLEEVDEKVKAVEEEGGKLDDVAKPIKEEGANPSVDDITDVIANLKVAVKKTKGCCKVASDFINEHRNEMESARFILANTRQTLISQQRRVIDVQSKADRLMLEAKQSKNQAIYKQHAQAYYDEEAKTFKKYGKDKKLDRKAVEAYAKEVQKHTLKDKDVNRIFSTLDPEKKGGVPIEKGRQLKIMVGIIREEAREAKRRAEREEKARLEREAAEKRAKEIENAKEVIKDKVTEALETLDDVEKRTKEATEKLAPLLSKDGEATIEDLISLAEEVVESLEKAKAESQKCRQNAEEIKNDKEMDEEVIGFARGEANKVFQRCNKLDGQLTATIGRAKSGRDHLVKDRFTEVDELRTKVILGFRKTMDDIQKGFEELFGAITKGDTVSEADLLEYAKKCADLKDIDEEKLKKAFGSLTSSAWPLSKETFATTFRVYMKVVKQTVITDNLSIKLSSTIRRVEVGEIIEVHEGPKFEVIEATDGKEQSKLTRVKGIMLKDKQEGFVTVAGNQGTVFLEHGGNVYKVKHPVDLTDGMDGKESKSLKKLQRGELVEVIDWEAKDEASGDKRLKCMLKGDGTVGWATYSDTTGKVYMEVNL